MLVKDLDARGLRVERQRPISIDYRGMHFKDCCRIDILVDGLVIVEVKSVETLIPLHGKQLLTYLRLSNLRVGLLINFGAARLKDGIRRVLNGYSDSVPSWLCVNQDWSATGEMQQKK